MSKWEELDLERKLVGLLENVPEYEEGHHLRRPFMTAYQIAIEFAHSYPADVDALDLPVGGAGTGRYNSLAQYFANQLSKQIKAGNSQFEGGFLSNRNLKDMVFDNDGMEVRSSRSGAPLITSIFRASSPQ